jgi:hypothetical protein
MKNTTGENVEDVTIKYSWISIPKDFENIEDTSKTDDFLVNPRVAEYIEFLELQRDKETLTVISHMTSLNDAHLQHKVLNTTPPNN